MVEMEEEEKSMRYKTGLQQVHDLLHMLYGIMEPRISTELVLKAWQT